MKPMLAGKADLDKLTFPVVASPKLDGIRALVKDGRLVSRKLLDIPNRFTFARFKHLEGIDGELILGDPCAPDVYRMTNGAVMRHEEEPDLTLYVFDHWNFAETPYAERLASIRTLAAVGAFPAGVKVLDTVLISSRDELDAYEADHVAKGYEGIMVRKPDGLYKFGRSSPRSAELLKVKRFEDSEALVLDVVELLHNGNEAERDHLGRTKRSTKAEGKTGKGTMGALQVRDLETGKVFFLGTGFSAEERAWWWDRRADIGALQLIVKYKFFAVGVKELPRHPVMLGLRNAVDIGDVAQP